MLVRKRALIARVHHNRQEVVVATSDGGLYVLSVEVNSEDEDEQQGAQDDGAERGRHETLGGTNGRRYR